VATEKPEGVIIALKIHISDCVRRTWDVVAVLLGVLVTFFVSVYSRCIVNRDQLLIPFTVARKARDHRGRPETGFRRMSTVHGKRERTC
jgi:hypothetical protein